MVNQKYFEGDKHFHLYVDLDEEVILGKYTPKMMKDAIDEFVSENYNRLVKPKLNRRDEYGRVSAEPKKVIREVKDRLFKLHYGNKR